MINYLDSQNTQKLLELEVSSLNATYSIQQTLNKQILAFMKNYIGNINVSTFQSPDSKIFYYIKHSNTILNKSNTNIKTLDSFIENVKSIQEESKTLSKKQIEKKLDTYNSKFLSKIDTVYKNTHDIEAFIHEISTLDLDSLKQDDSISVNTEVSVQNNDALSAIISSDSLSDGYIENTLIISEIQKKVILPFTVEEISQVLLDNPEKYSSLDRVVEKEFTKPYKYYKPSAFARFREARKLVLEREHGSSMKALSLGFELFMNYNLHPAIISACKTLDQLDVYLACLEDDTLEDFKFFNIKFEITPFVQKKSKASAI